MTDCQIRCKSCIKIITNVISQATVEPFLFFVMFGHMVKLASFQSFIADRTCRIEFNYSTKICDDIVNHKNEFISVTQYSNKVLLSILALSTLPAFIALIFVGPWSDKYGRKMPLIIATCGMLIDMLLTTFISLISSVHPIYFLYTHCFSGISGGMIVSTSQTYSYLSEVTYDRARPARFAILEFFHIISNPLGILIGSQIYKVGGHVTVFIVASCSVGCALLWVIFMLKETKARNPETTKAQIYCDFFHLNSYKENFETGIRKRPGNLRLQIWLIIFVDCMLLWITVGSISIDFQYTALMFNWNGSKFLTVVVICYCCQAFATLVIIPLLNNKMMLHEAAIGLIGILSLLAKMVILSVSFKQELIIYALLCGILIPCSKVALKSRLSKLISKQELGRVFSLQATFSAAMPILGTIFMTQIYNASSKWYPGLPYAIVIVVSIPLGVIFGWMSKFPTMSFAKYKEIEDMKVMKELKDVSNYL